MSLNARVSTLEKKTRTGGGNIIFIEVPAGSAKAEIDEAKARELDRLNLRPEAVAGWYVISGLRIGN